MNAQPLIDYLSRYIILTSEEETLFLSKVRFQKYLKGQYVVQQGDVCHYESFVISGCLKTFYIDHEGHEHIVMFAVEDWWTADLGSFLSQKPASYNVQCLENVSLPKFLTTTWRRCILRFPNLSVFSASLYKKLL